MTDPTGLSMGRHRGCFLLVAGLALAFSTYVDQVASLPADPSINPWPTFPRRNIAALARDGYLKNSVLGGYKRSISTLAKNGQLPTFRSPYDETDKQDDQDEEESHAKRNIASIARLRSYSAMKRNIQALARDGFRAGRGQYNQQNDKRNLAALARNGMIHKKDEISADEYYYPFYQNPIPPLSEIDGPYDFNEMYDYQQSVNPDMFPPLSQVFKRSSLSAQAPIDLNQLDEDSNWYYKRGIMGMPVHGLYRPAFTEPNVRNKRYILNIPDVIDHNDIHPPENESGSDDKRSVGSIPLTRISELGNISLVPKLTQQSIQTTPTYRRRQYLLTRTRPVGSSTDR